MSNDSHRGSQDGAADPDPHANAHRDGHHRAPGTPRSHAWDAPDLRDENAGDVVAGPGPSGGHHVVGHGDQLSLGGIRARSGLDSTRPGQGALGSSSAAYENLAWLLRNGLRESFPNADGVARRATGVGEFRVGPHVGKGPKGYARSDEQIRGDLCEYLTIDGDVDASGVEVSVMLGVVTLVGTTPDRAMKHAIEDHAWETSGVKDVENRLRVVKSA